jgi:hypothetical protein
MEWLALFKQHAAKREEVDLIHFSRDYAFEVCERIAKRHGMTFETNPERETAFLRKLQSNRS